MLSERARGEVAHDLLENLVQRHQPLRMSPYSSDHQADAAPDLLEIQQLRA
jgi:hypothetical protein